MTNNRDMAAAPPEVSLEIANRQDEPVLANLLELYIHDLSEAFAVDIRADGRFGYNVGRYWNEPDRRYPFLIRANGRLAGFALIQRGSPATDDPADLDIAEFFVLRRHRRSGVGRLAARQLWDRMPGHWVVRVSNGNLPALPFWRAVIEDYTGGAFSEEQRPGSPHSWTVLQLNSPRR